LPAAAGEGCRRLSPPRNDDRRCRGRGVRQDRETARPWLSRRPRGRADCGGRRSARGAAAAPAGRPRRTAFLPPPAPERRPTGGPAVERIAAGGDPRAVPLPRPLVGSAEPHFSFAGLKSAVARAAASGTHGTADLAASFQQAVVDCLVDRSRIALAACPEASAFVVAGGVAANGAIRTALTELAPRHGKRVVAPPLWL